MKLIKLFKRCEIGVIPNGHEYLMVASNNGDPFGEWVPTESKSFADWRSLQTTLRQMVDAEDIVIRSSPHFKRRAVNFVLTERTLEWWSN